uniref:Uncharacterized protein n=1 Tax=Syphacia muris TaxID=451379 RepID=A0A0N5A8N3_9BILA
MSWSMAPRVGRFIRAKRYLKELPGRLWRDHPEQVVFGGTFGVAGVIIAAYKLWKYGTRGVKPWHRGYYDVVRPDDVRALGWRTPEDYPAPYLTNRQNKGPKYYKRDYGWKSELSVDMYQSDFLVIFQDCKSWVSFAQSHANGKLFKVNCNCSKPNCLNENNIEECRRQWVVVEFMNCEDGYSVDAQAVKNMFATWLNEECGTTLVCETSLKFAPTDISIDNYECSVDGQHFWILVRKNVPQQSLDNYAEQLDPKILMSIIYSREHPLASTFHSDIKSVGVLNITKLKAHIKEASDDSQSVSFTVGLMIFTPSFLIAFSVMYLIMRCCCLQNRLKLQRSDSVENIELRAATRDV